MARSILVPLLSALLAASDAAAQDWHGTASELIKSEMPGYGGLRALVVDHSTGTLFLNLSDKGIYRSDDRAKTWRRLPSPITGRGEAPGGLLLDPIGGKRLVAAFIYGGPMAVSTDLGETWKQLDMKTRHVDWCAVDWSDPDMRFLLALKHESGGLLLVSRDGGKSVEEVDKGFGPAWIFDNQTAVVAESKTKDRPNPRILRTTDAAKSFQPVADHAATLLPRWHKETLYWLTDRALIASADRGKTWKKLSEVKDARFGPIFGNGPQMFVLTGSGILESSDSGVTWARPIAAPTEMKGLSVQTWIEYDPVHDILYIMKSGSDLYQWTRGKQQ
jgi:BNR-Asp box repeat